MVASGQGLIRVFPDVPFPRKFKSGWVRGRVRRNAGLPRQAGPIMFELDGVPEAIAREFLALGAAKLPIKTKFIKRIAGEDIMATKAKTSDRGRPCGPKRRRTDQDADGSEEAAAQPALPEIHANWPTPPKARCVVKSPGSHQNGSDTEKQTVLPHPPAKAAKAAPKAKAKKAAA